MTHTYMRAGLQSGIHSGSSLYKCTVIEYLQVSVFALPLM